MVRVLFRTIFFIEEKLVWEATILPTPFIKEDLTMTVLTESLLDYISV